MRSLFNAVELVNTQSIPIDQAQMISIEYIAEAVTVYDTDDDVLVIKEYFNEKDPDIFADIAVEQDNIIIRHGSRPILFSFLRGYVEIYLPRRYFGALNIKTISGKIAVDGRLSLNELTITSTSGRIALGDVTAGTAVLSTVSGAIAVENLRAEANVRTTSGSIRIENAAGSGDYKSVSGFIHLKYHTVMGDITAASTSGKVFVMLPKDLSFSYRTSTVSGGVDVRFTQGNSGGRRATEGTIGDTPRVHVRLKTISGRIEIVPIL